MTNKLYCILLFIVFYSCQGLFAEIRGVWLTTNYQLDWPSQTGTSEKIIEQQKSELIKILDDLAYCGINTVFFQARVRGAVFYHSELEVQSRYFSGTSSQKSNFDPLRFVVESCHQRGMSCHAWIVCIPFGSSKDIQLNKSQAFLRKNKDFLTFFQGTYYLEPSSPKTQQYLVSIATEIVSKYKVDGIHLDYIRYPENAKKYPDQTYFHRSLTKLSLADWRRENITKIVYAIYDAVKKVNSSIQVSSAPLGFCRGEMGGNYYAWNAYDAVYQDVEKWMKDEKQDLIIPMMYYKDVLFQPFLSDWLSRSHHCKVIPGLGLYRLLEKNSEWNWLDIENQIKTIRDLSAGGYVLFRTKNLIYEHPFLYWRIQQLNNPDTDESPMKSIENDDYSPKVDSIRAFMMHFMLK